MQKAANDVRISDGSSEGCSSDLAPPRPDGRGRPPSCSISDRIARRAACLLGDESEPQQFGDIGGAGAAHDVGAVDLDRAWAEVEPPRDCLVAQPGGDRGEDVALARGQRGKPGLCIAVRRSEEHTSELQSLMRNSYAVFCLKKKKK